MRAFIGKRVGGFFVGVSSRVHVPSLSLGFALGVIAVLLAAVFLAW